MACGCFGPPSLGVGEKYSLASRIGKGGQATVWLASENDTGDLYALKFMESRGKAFSTVIAKAMIREVQCSVALGEGHVNIIRPHELLLTTSHIVLVTQYSDGGGRSEYFDSHDRSEDLAAYFFHQIADAISYCHRKGIAYRDVKLENTLVDASNPPVIRLCDFGVARKVEKDAAGRPKFERMSTFTGTPGSLSPQILNAGLGQNGAPQKPSADGGKSGVRLSKNYDGAKADVWSAGVLLCCLLMKENPFAVDDFLYKMDPLDALERNLQKLEADCHWSGLLKPAAKKLYDGLSAELKDLLDRMLEVDEEKRIGMAEVVEHPWLKRVLPGHLAGKLEEMRAAQAVLDKDAAGRPKYNERDGDKLIEEMVEFVFSEEYEKMGRGKPHIVKALQLGWALLPQCKDETQRMHGRLSVPNSPSNKGRDGSVSRGL